MLSLLLMDMVRVDASTAGAAPASRYGLGFAEAPGGTLYVFGGVGSRGERRRPDRRPNDPELQPRLGRGSEGFYRGSNLVPEREGTVSYWEREEAVHLGESREGQ